MWIDEVVEPIKVTRLALIDADRRLVKLSVFSGSHPSDTHMLNLIMGCHFVYDVTAGKTIKSRWALNGEEALTIATLINHVGVDLGLVTIKRY